MSPHLKTARLMSAFEAGLTPEEREELYAQQGRPTPNYFRTDPYMARGARMRQMSKNPLLGLLAAASFSSPKTAMVMVHAFGNELQRIKANE